MMSDKTSKIVDKDYSGTDYYFASSNQFGNKLVAFGDSVCYSAERCLDY